VRPLHFAAVADERIRLEVQERAELGSRVTRRLRKQGLVPGVLYGRGHKPRAIAIPERELRRALTGSHGLHAILDVVLEGQKTTHASILKDYQQHPLRSEIVHVDLQEVRLDQPIHATVVVELVGDSPGVREGGVLTQAAREVTVEALPMEVPDRLELDVSGLGVGDSLRVADLAAQDGVTFLDDPETVLATVTTPTPVLEPEEMLEEGEEAQRPPEAEAPQKASEAQSDAGADDAAGSPGTVPG
jgi:large subunit ribosomal protein L25